MTASWAYFVSLYPRPRRDFAELSKTKLTMPVLAIGGEKANGDLLGKQMKIVATNATMVVLKKHRTLGGWKKTPVKRSNALMKFL